MKNIFKIISGVLLISTIVFSCSKIKDENNTKVLKPAIPPIACPISQFGISLNNAMDYIAANPDFLNLSLEEIYNYSFNYSDEYFNFSIVPSWDNHQSKMELYYSLIESPEEAGNILFDNNRIPSYLIGLVDSLSIILNNAADYENGTYKSIEEFTGEIEAFESFIIANYNIIYNPETKIGNEYAGLLGACSIAKNSYAYWVDAATNEEHVWFYRLDQITYNGGFKEKNSKAVFGKVWHAIKVAAVDTWAFVSDWEEFEDPITHEIVWRWVGEHAVATASEASSGVK